MVKPCIPSAQGKGGGAEVVVEEPERLWWSCGGTGRWSLGDAWCSPLLGRLGGAGRGDGPPRADAAVLVLGLLLRGLQDLQNKNDHSKKTFCRMTTIRFFRVSLFDSHFRLNLLTFSLKR